MTEAAEAEEEAEGAMDLGCPLVDHTVEEVCPCQKSTGQATKNSTIEVLVAVATITLVVVEVEDGTTWIRVTTFRMISASSTWETATSGLTDKLLMTSLSQIVAGEVIITTTIAVAGVEVAAIGVGVASEEAHTSF